MTQKKGLTIKNVAQIILKKGLISEEQYAAIPDKTSTADWPDKLLYRPTIASSLGTVIVHPVPNGTVTVKLVTRIQLTSIASTATTVTLPPGWNRYLTNQLAIELAPEYETTPAPSVLKAASEAMAGIKRVNTIGTTKTVTTELGEMFARGSSHIESDE